MTGAVLAIIFDFDATLGKASHDKAAAHREMFARLGDVGLKCKHDEFISVLDRTLDALNRTRMETEVEPTFDAYYGQVLTNLGIRPNDELVRQWRELLLANHQFNLYPTTSQTLQRLADRGYRMAVVSNTINGTTTYSLERAGLVRLFAAVIQSCDVGIRKPSPRIFQLALDALGVAADETVCVGNSPYFDIAEPHRMGMTTVWMRTELSYREPPSSVVAEIPADRSIGRLAELLPIVGA